MTTKQQTPKPPIKIDVPMQIRSGPKKGESLPPKRDSFQQAAVKQVLMSNQVGDGLWCYQKENTTPQQNQTNNSNLFKHDQQFDPEIVKRSEKIMNQKTHAMNAQMESEINLVLEKECNELGIKMELQSVKLCNQNIQLLQQQQSYSVLSEKFKEANTEILNLRQLRINFESQIESIKDLYNKSKREIASLSSQLEEKIMCNQDLLQLRQKLENALMEQQQQAQQECEVLRERLEEIEEENEDLKNRLQIRGDIERRVDSEKYQQQSTQQSNVVRDKGLKLEKMGKLLEEHATLTEKLGESDQLKRKFMEKNIASEKEMKQIVEQKNEMSKQVSALKKRVNDLSIMKSTNNKIQEDKISKLQEQCDNAMKENDKYKKFLQKKSKLKQQFSDEEEEEAVQARPQLFGA